MGKKEDSLKLLLPLLKASGSRKKLEETLVANSNLPGKRANLELAFAVADFFGSGNLNESSWKMLTEWARIAPEDAPVNHPKEFLPFCAILSLGSSYSLAGQKNKAKVIDIIKNAASDPKWRMREAAAMGFQRIAEKDFNVIKRLFSEWIGKATFSEKRAILVALAHPPILNKEENVAFCFQMADEVLQGLLDLKRSDEETEEYTILKKGLGFTLSVYVVYSPGKGFSFLKEWAQKGNEEIRKIIKTNLSKSRLVKQYGDRIREIQACL